MSESLEGFLRQHPRYRFDGVRASVPMSPASLNARDLFIERFGLRDPLEEQDCFLCGRREFEPLSEIDRYGFYYPTGWCRNCGNVQQTAYYDERVVAQFYEGYYRAIYDHRDPRELFESQRDGVAPRIHRFVSAVGRPRSVLEVGCGAGGILAHFRDRGCSVTGLDFDERFLEVARDQGIEVHAVDVAEFDPQRRFDCILLSHVVEHIVDPVEFLVTIRSRLTRDGLLYVEVPSLNQVRAGGYCFDLLRYYQNAHTAHYSRATLENLAFLSGFDVAEADDFIRSVWTPRDRRGTLDPARTARSREETTRLILGAERDRRSLRGALALARHHTRRLLVAGLSAVRLEPAARRVYRAVRDRLGSGPRS